MAKRSRKSSSVASEAQTGNIEHNELMDVLKSHGQSFLSNFDLPAPTTVKSKTSKKRRKLQTLNRGEPSQEKNIGSVGEVKQAEEVLVPGPFACRVPEVVVFNECASSSTELIGRGKKGFMSSKINQVIEAPNPTKSVPDPEEDLDNEEEQSNTKNDKLLHELVHSKLLNNIQAYDTNQGSGKRSRTVAGRLVELADAAKVGQGVASLAAKEQAKHAQRVRLGLREKAKQREIKTLDEAKALGNYHPSIKRNFMTSSSTSSKHRRERGLALGIGKFRNGALTINKDDLRSIRGPSDGGPKSGRGGKRR